MLKERDFEKMLMLMLRTPNGNNDNYINRAIQCLYPLEVRMDDPEDVAIEDLVREPGAEAYPAPPEPASIVPDVNAVDGGVEPSSTGSGGEYVVNEIGVPIATTRSGRRTRPWTGKVRLTIAMKEEWGGAAQAWTTLSRGRDTSTFPMSAM
jgi:hypothetical protein